MDDSGVEELSDTLYDLSLPSDPLLAACNLEDMSSRLIASQLTHRDAVNNVTHCLVLEYTCLLQNKLLVGYLERSTLLTVL
jgi:hypothetical protein